uniref:Voltage-gated hydrogen channel 1 n=1 Tax=Timema poppense TaxID=170557 RepID=A0A7R9H830_TIMPO|nr:unnamed protein product [Timema poppensis]
MICKNMCLEAVTPDSQYLTCVVMALHLGAGDQVCQETTELPLTCPDRSSSLTIPTHKKRQPPRTFRERARAVIENSKFHIAILTLVIIDLILVLIELVIDASALEHSSQLEMLENALKYSSITILSIFVVENLFTIYVMGWDFFKHFLEVFDFTIVVTSLVLDIVFMHSHAQAGFGLLIILRLWRIVRVINAIVVAMSSQAERELEEERDCRYKLETKLKHCNNSLKKQATQIQALLSILQSHNIEIPSSLLPSDTNNVTT